MDVLLERNNLAIFCELIMWILAIFVLIVSLIKRWISFLDILLVVAISYLLGYILKLFGGEKIGAYFAEDPLASIWVFLGTITIMMAFRIKRGNSGPTKPSVNQ